MELKKCSMGHFYDASVNTMCPYCSGNVTNNASRIERENEEKTVAINYQSQEMCNQQCEKEKTMPLISNSFNENEERTVALLDIGTQEDPIVGWLVCINGEDKGKDYRLHSDNNYIGRSIEMDVYIKNDLSISRQCQAIITYDSMTGEFYLRPKEGRNVIRKNGKTVFEAEKINEFDKIVIGKTELLFIPFCGERFRWNE